MNIGSFSRDPRTIWLTELGDDRNMQLIEAFSFTAPDGSVWDAPQNSVVDGASIPRPLWSVVGSPYTGDYRRASIVHDIACDRAMGDSARRRAADRMFYHACRAGECSVLQSTLLYIGVRIGAHWTSIVQWGPALAPAQIGPQFSRTATDLAMERDFQQASQLVLRPGEVDDVNEVERRTDEALSAVTGVDLRFR